MGSRRLGFWRFALDAIDCSGSVYLWVVVHDWGSAPGKTGFKLLVTKDGWTRGTIGGGVMESDLVARPWASEPVLVRKVHLADAAREERSGMICAGGQLMVGCVLEEDQRPVIESILDSEKQQNPKWIHLTQRGLSLRESGIQGFVNHELEWTYQEEVGCVPILYVIGAGHVGKAIAKQFQLLDFHVVVLDDRAEMCATCEGVADEVVVAGFDEIGSVIDSEKARVAVVTRAFDTDITALKSLLNRQFGYLGLMGSHHKIARIKQELLAAGARRDWLDQIVAPLGIPISNRTPAEIAVSLAAQLISLR